MSRRRKKAYVQSLEEKVAKLTARLAELEQMPVGSLGTVASTHEYGDGRLVTAMRHVS